jgi:phosphoribosyl-ATP pyrophosphohydrolase/phosphoribosyl-AMP cyclohydrolase
MKIDFAKNNGLVPAIVQDAYSMKVLMLGYMNEEAFEKTKEENFVHFYSRSRQELWKKGESSGNFLEVKELLIDCDNDTILVKAIPYGPTCHTGSTTCFNEENEKGFLYQLEKTIENRIASSDETSYTKSLVNRGINKVAQKVGEEAVELVIEAKDNNEELFKEEAADLLYHLLILLSVKSVKLEDVEKVLRGRQR